MVIRYNRGNINIRNLTSLPQTRGIPELKDFIEEQSKSVLAIQAIDHIIIASNRGPCEFSFSEGAEEGEGSLRVKRGAGGVVTALSSLGKARPVTWFSSAMTEGDRAVAGDPSLIPAEISEKGAAPRFVTVDPEVYRKAYNQISNPFLWFVQHYLWNPIYAPVADDTLHDAWDNGYVPYNEAFAGAIATEATALTARGLRPAALIQDYHLYLVAGILRHLLPDLPIQFFLHIPWPGADYWRFIPTRMCRQIMESLVAADILGLQTEHDRWNFLTTAREFLPGAKVNFTEGIVSWQQHLLKVRVYPVSIDPVALTAEAAAPSVLKARVELAKQCVERTIIRVDRLDPSKNILRGFQAYASFLSRHPEWHRRVKFLAFLVPSRLEVPQYQEYSKEVLGAIEEINNQYGGDGWQPIELYYGNDMPRALAAMQLYDVLLVNPLIDGMNLVAKEGPTVNDRDGVLILSSGAGAHAELAKGALTITPTDISATADALWQALEMPAVERKMRARLLKAAVASYDIARWLQEQVDDLTSEVAEGPAWQDIPVSTVAAAQLPPSFTVPQLPRFSLLAEQKQANPLDFELLSLEPHEEIEAELALNDEFFYPFGPSDHSNIGRSGLNNVISSGSGAAD